MTDKDDRPRDLDTLKALMLARHADFPKRIATLAHYAVDHPDDIAFGTVASIAEAARVSPSTLVRFGQLLGYSGFSDLQSVFQQAGRARIVSKAASHAAFETGPARDDRNAIQETVEACRMSLDAMGETIRLADIRAASGMLSTADSVFILADKDALPFASFFHRRLVAMNIRAILLTDMVSATDILVLARRGDAAVILETAPSSSALAAHVVTIRDRQIPIVCMTDTPLSPTAALATIRFDLAGAGRDALSRVTAGIVLGDALANGIHASLQTTGG
ncbi:hypothetical protein ASG25_10330 [Rhizobium sp. Leaf384]|uniref:MurR/RpiR family transcriptional regulator n=1 Tax=unclassified Rhizobium TaxID=2613769 RepID=UPI0007154915|nr:MULTISPECIES: MurR/RpiR family transcriptional regulator [unclassified Rhizobium]KQS78985.1 hypothetical protein ASG25_10330 [Rhizobium sp. Leaf384]KQS82623.1 hypothetical protein ASG58_04530 [Rhizobium sp. Leaf383]